MIVSHSDATGAASFAGQPLDVKVLNLNLDVVNKKFYVNVTVYDRSSGNTLSTYTYTDNTNTLFDNTSVATLAGKLMAEIAKLMNLHNAALVEGILL